MLASAMEGGTGTSSYSSNSITQNYLFHAFATTHLAEAIRHCSIPLDSPPSHHPFHIADFGCAHGRNTLDCAAFVVERIRQRYTSAGALHPEIHYFFSDLPSNDFNNLFQSLQPIVTMPLENQETGHGHPDFYAAGVPGSFYGRLFPKASLDFAVSLFSLHWLSQVPPAVLDKSSPSWNGGYVWIHGERPTVAEAYAQQCQSDVKSFLKCRAQELRNGAIMFLFSVSRTEEHPKGLYFLPHGGLSVYLEATWHEMVSEGLVDAEERDLFNLPIYNFCSAELEKALNNVPELELLKIEKMKERPCLPPDEMQQMLNNPQMFGEYMVGFGKSLTRPIVEEHLGEERAAVFFKKLQRIATEDAMLRRNITYDILVAILRRCK